MDEHSLECLDFARIRELLASYALSGPGRHLALGIQPIGRRELIDRWYRQIREFQQLVRERGAPPFAGITDVRELVANCAPPLKVAVEDVARIGDALAATHAMSEYIDELPEESTELRHLATRIGDYRTIAERIHAVLDGSTGVRDDASPKLARIRNDIRKAGSEIEGTVQRMLRDGDVQKVLQYDSFTFHNDRLVLPVRTECRGRLKGIIHRTSDSGATVYVEPAAAVELNNQISNLRVEEEEEVNRLLWELTHEIYVNAEGITKTLDALAVLDLIVAKVRFAAAFEMECPELLEENVIQMRRARHPLLVEMARQRAEQGEPFEVVPIDYRLGEDFDLLVITGPNTGGKTVTLKTIGLIALMVQAGLPVPVAEGSRTGVFSNVLIDIGDEQSMQQSLSTFSAHLKRQLETLKRAGPKTLVLIDELGAGTDPDEGAAIGRSILDELLRLECRCAATTHIGALKGFALTRERAENGSVEFDQESLRPTYHLRTGQAGASNAIEIARRLGMPKRLVIAARRNLSHRSRALRSALAGADAAKRDAEDARLKAEDAHTQATRSHAEAEAARANLRKQQADFQSWVSRVAHLQPGDAVRVRNFDRDGKIVRLRVDLHRAEVDVGAFAVEVPLGDVLPPESPEPPPPPPKPARTPLVPVGKPKPKARASRPAPPRQRKPEPAAPSRPDVPSMPEAKVLELRPGDRVYAKRFHRPGTIVRLNEQKKFAVVNVGLLEVEIPFDGLAAPNADRAKASHQRKRASRPQAPPGEKPAT